MATITRSTNIARPAEEVFAYLDDFTARGEWRDGVKSINVIGDGPTKVGTEVEETRVMGGREIEMRWRVTEHDPVARRSAFETVESKMMKPSGVISVASVGDGSEVTFSMDTNPVGLGRLLAPMMNRQATSTIEGDLARLKRHLEGGGAANPSE
jgi:uncharacterized membrane protein